MTGAPPRGVARRSVLRGALAGGAALATGGLLGACSARQDAPRIVTDDRWRQFAGATINLISENTAPTAAIAANLKPFTDLTGINVNIVTLELSALVQKVALDLAGGESQYHVIYADPYQVLAPYSKGLVDLRELAAQPGLPEFTGWDDFIPTQLDAAGRFGDRDKIFAVPYDCPTMIWQYRADLFDKYGARMADDLGFDPTPGLDRTWDEYLRIARWFNDNADEVAYGTGHQAKQHDSLMCDFSNVLWSYGGDYFDNGTEVGLYGTTDPGPCRLGSDQAIAAAEFYQRLLSIADPSSKTWDWNGLAPALSSGRIAMCVNWHEYAAANEKAMPGRFGYAPLPRGPVRSANHYGGCGIGINGNTQPNERMAAWLFVLWATSTQTQLANLKSEAGGGTPTRQSVYDLPEVRAAEHRPSAMPNILAAPAVATAWQPENIGLRPKIPMWNECDTAVYTQLSKMLAGDSSPADTMRGAATKIDRITARGWAA
ncbi:MULTISPECIES: extracellular solute-binding protein [Amycolatopsis]|uniref:Sugar ABC transporter substrate-binding protein n=1 Tax=Amycolatopsis tucumanensis TaxID=401106 RepID=A0ABP7I036_9PSEU|nr:extracellular solute-binding protein [Amycolatopsis tucumanensis]MCF6428108.1 extracellular solute-binding protein [Amycolatopsis tucumanensis]